MNWKFFVLSKNRLLSPTSENFQAQLRKVLTDLKKVPIASQDICEQVRGIMYTDLQITSSFNVDLSRKIGFPGQTMERVLDIDSSADSLAHAHF